MKNFLKKINNEYLIVMLFLSVFLIYYIIISFTQSGFFNTISVKIFTIIFLGILITGDIYFTKKWIDKMNNKN